MAQICARLNKKLPEGVMLSCCMGIAFFPQDGATYDRLFKCADTALSVAKKTGRNHFMFYSPHMDSHTFTPCRTPIDGE